MMDQWKGTKADKVHNDFDFKWDKVHLPCTVDMAKCLEDSFG